MRAVALGVGFVVAIALTGCAKKPPQVADKSADTPAVTPTPAPTTTPKPKPPGTPAKPADKKAPAEKPNWLDPKPKQPDELPVDDAKSPNKQPWIPGGIGTPAPLPVPPVGKNPEPKGVVPPQPAPMPAPMTTPAAAGKRVTKDDMNEVWIFTENFSLASGKMPGPDLIYAALLKEMAASAALVKDGSIALTGAKSREGIWAYEKNAPTQGGWIATQNGVEQVTAAEFARLAALTSR